MKVIIAGGGTGGHIFPAVAIANKIKSSVAQADVLFVGANGKMEMEKVPKEGYKIIGLDIVGFNRSSLWKNFALPFKLWKSNKKAKNIIKAFRPDIVIGVGGFASFPMLNAAQSMGIPTLIQEQNSFAGKSNKILAKKAYKVCVAYEGMEAFFPSSKIVMTGNPVRESITGSQVTKEDSLKFFGLSNNKKTLLVVGGSLGAKSINEAIAAQVEKLVQQDVQILWQTGKLFKDTSMQLMQRYPNHVFVHEFIYEMDKAYAAADIIVSRAGALAIAEICVVAQPTIFVPYPFAAEDHQTSNAMALVKHNAAEIVKDKEVNEQLVNAILNLIHNEDKQQIMKAQLQKLAVKDAAERIFNQVKQIINTK